MKLESDQTDINRRTRARELAEQCGGKAAFAERIGRTSGQVNHIIGPNPSKNIGKALARHIETSFGKPRGWLDTGPEAEFAGVRSPAASLAGYDRSERAEALMHQLTFDQLLDIMRPYIRGLSLDQRVHLARIALEQRPQDSPKRRPGPKAKGTRKEP